ncbi:hypothetical protein [Amycolatopsis minnesotensis]|uniref:Uncharacterized protein n=1 Tax=Amycolatopsis minnesotensis TaxID=337894 RepID=A0ABN2SGW5_9PSEU
MGKGPKVFSSYWLDRGTKVLYRIDKQDGEVVGIDFYLEGQKDRIHLHMADETAMRCQLTLAEAILNFRVSARISERIAQKDDIQPE